MSRSGPVGSQPSSDRVRALDAGMWRDNNVQTHGDGVKRLRHPRLGPITLEYSAFAVDARPDLSLIVYNPATPADQKLIASLVNESQK